VDARGTRDDNSWYSPGERTLTFGTGDVDDAEDGETVLHEFGHALQDAICPDFGQSPEAAAMGEGFGDYFAASFFAAKKRDPYVEAVMSWDGALGDGDPPCVRRVDSRLTYESFDHGPRADEHDNGQIWSATLWDIWKATGRPVADRIIVESHFQLDGFTTFARGARAILDADRNLYRDARDDPEADLSPEGHRARGVTGSVPDRRPAEAFSGILGNTWIAPRSTTAKAEAPAPRRKSCFRHGEWPSRASTSRPSRSVGPISRRSG